MSAQKTVLLTKNIGQKHFDYKYTYNMVLPRNNQLS